MTRRLFALPAAPLAAPAFLGLLFAAQAKAAVHYVSPKGSASWEASTTVSSPCSLATANARASAGDKVLLRGGIYRGSINPSKSGTPQAPIEFSSFAGEVVILEGAESIANWEQDAGNRYRAVVNFRPDPPFSSSRDPGGNRGGLVLQDGVKMKYAMAASAAEVDAEGEYYMNDSGNPPYTLYAVVRNLGSGYNPGDYRMAIGRYRKGLDLDAGQDYLVVRNITFRNYNDNAVHSVGSVNCRFLNLRLHSNFITGIYLTAGSNNNEIRNCEFWDNGHGGIELAGSRFNSAAVNRFLHRDLGNGYGGNGCHIYLGPSDLSADGNVIENNVAFSSGSDYANFGFLAIGNGNDNLVRNNSYVDTRRIGNGGMGGITLAKGARNRVINNAVQVIYGRSCIAVFAEAVADGGHTIRFNDFYKADPSGAYYWNGIWHSSLKNWEDASGQSGNISAEPGFVDPAREDLHLRDDSACKDRGTTEDAPAADFDGVPRPQGIRADIGAFEYFPAAQPDLVVQSGSSGFAPAPVAPGGVLQPSTWSIRNRGPGRAGGFSSAFFLSPDPVITVRDTYLSAVAFPTGLAAGESLDWDETTLTVPADTLPGTYFLGVLADAGSSIAESDEENNDASVRVTVVPGCTYSIVSTGLAHGSGNEAGRVWVVAPAGCAWSATSPDAWITIEAGSTGSGSGSVIYSVAANTRTSPRAGTIAVAGQALPITQAGGVLPSISTLEPALVAAGGPGIDLTLTGSNFVAGSKVRWNGQDRATSFQGMSQLRATIPSSDLVAPGTATLSVVNPWGGVSNTRALEISAPTGAVPIIRSLSPLSVPVSGAGFILAVSGFGFVPASKVRWNGSDRATVFESSTLLTASIPASDIARVGTTPVAVVNPPRDGGISGDAIFDACVAPCITQLSPSAVLAGGSEFRLAVFGTGFTAASTSDPGSKNAGESPAGRLAAGATPTVLWNGQPLSTTVVQSTQLVATVPAILIASAGTATVSVTGLAGGGNASNAVALSIAAARPAPFLVRVTPEYVEPGSPSFTLTAEGLNFTVASKVLWNGAALNTEFVDSTRLLAMVPAAEVLAPGAASVAVFSPAPGGGVSNSRTFRSVQSLLYPRLASRYATSGGTDDSEYTGIAVANLGAVDAILTLTAFDRSGDLVSGPAITNPATLAVKRGEQLPIVDFQALGATLPERKPLGWFKVESPQSEIAGFFLMFNASLTVLDGADVSPATQTTAALPEVEDQGTTWIHVANPDSQPATVLLELYRADGTLEAAATRILRPNAAVVETLSDLFPGAELSGYVRAASSRGTVLFEYLGKEGRYAQGLRGQDAAAGSTTLYSPQFVAGGRDWRSAVSVVNLDSSPGIVTFRFIGDDGAVIGAPQVRSIAGKGRTQITDQDYYFGPGDTLKQGFLEIRSDGVRMAGSVVFGDPGRSKFSSALPLLSTLRRSAVFSQVASDDTYFTGLAILNPNSLAANVTIDLYDREGHLIASKMEIIAALNRRSQLLTQYFPWLAGQERNSGYVRVEADRPVAAFALFGTHNLSVLSAVPPQVAR